MKTITTFENDYNQIPQSAIEKLEVVKLTIEAFGFDFSQMTVAEAFSMYQAIKSAISNEFNEQFLNKKYMIDYTKMTTEELVSELDKLNLGLEMDLSMDGSGELGGIISKGYDKYFDAIYQVLNERPDFVIDENNVEMPF